MQQPARRVWIKCNYVSLCLNLWVPVKQTEDKSTFPLCWNFPRDALTGRHLVSDLAENVKRAQHMLILSCTIILNSVLFNFDLFPLCFLYPLSCVLPHLPVSSWLLIFPLCDDDGSCLFPDAQTLFMVPLNNSALMEIFNIACWSPLGAFDGLLLKIGIYMRAGQVEHRKELGVNKLVGEK